MFSRKQWVCQSRRARVRSCRKRRPAEDRGLRSSADMSSLAESILEQMGDAVIYADETGTIRMWNSAAAILFGYSAAEAVGHTLDLIVPAHLRDAHWHGFDAAMTAGVMKLNGRPTLTRATHQSGRKLYVELTFALVKGLDASRPLGAVAVARDVTERTDRQRGAGDRAVE